MQSKCTLEPPTGTLGDVHFDWIYLSIQMVKIHKNMTTSSHINLEQDPTVTFSKKFIFKKFHKGAT
jgi:hypothetical protein